MTSQPKEFPPASTRRGVWVDGERLFSEMTSSINRMLAAEYEFDQLRELYRTHPRYAGLDEATQETRHGADPRTKQAITQCRFFRERAGVFAAAYAAWDMREQRYAAGEDVS